MSLSPSYLGDLRLRRELDREEGRVGDHGHRRGGIAGDRSARLLQQR